MTETILSMSEVLLYGERVTDMKYIDPDGTKAEDIKYFVRVFGYGFEGGSYALDAPIIMLLTGKGGSLPDTTPADVKNSFATSIMQWSVDKHDRSVRLDELTGTFEEILLEVELDGGGGGRVSGGRVSGGRVSGGRVSGGRVSGGRVSGGRVSGGRVSGGKAD